MNGKLPSTGSRAVEQNPSTEMRPASSGRVRARPSWGLVSAAMVAALLAFLPEPTSAALTLSHREAMQIGRKIWQNECGGSISGLTSWNTGENFASLGIGHFIWYPQGQRGPFEESFPKLVLYVEQHGAKLPELLLGRNRAACPWNSRAEFLAAESSPRMKQLRIFLKDTIDLQAEFMVERLHEALPKMLAITTGDERAQIAKQFNRVASSSQGLYALIDYVNFKGEGVLASERYRGRGWGLLQVLEGMSGNDAGSAASEFANSAERVLRERVRNAPPERHEERWLAGWLNRIATYRE